MQSGDYRADNLFSRLFSYTPREGRIPLEDYCTEGLAWCLGQSEDFARGFLALTGIEFLRGYRGPIAVATQQSFKGSEDEDEDTDSQSSGGRFDLVIRPDHSNDFVLVVESKVFSGFHRSQLETYRAQLNRGPRFEAVPRARRFLVALTDHAAPEKPDQANGRLRWSRVCKLLEQPTEPKSAGPATRAKPNPENICQQFASFLKDNGMSLNLPKANSDIQNHVKGLLFRQELERLLKKIRDLNPALRKALKRTAQFDHDPDSDSTWLGLYSRPGRPSLYVGFRLARRGQSGYSMQVETEWWNEPPKRTAFKKRLEREFPGHVGEEAGWIQLRQRITPSYDGKPEKMIEWLGHTASRMNQLLAPNKAHKTRT